MPWMSPLATLIPGGKKLNDDTDSFVNAILAEAEGIKAHADDFLPESAPVEEVLV